MNTLIVFLLLAVVHIVRAAAKAPQSLQAKVWGAVIYTNIGDSTPEFWKERGLTSLGGQQLYNAGAAFANRYVRPTDDRSAAINGISERAINHRQLDIRAQDDPAVVGSSLAFMQGLYPPFVESQGTNDTSSPDSWADYPFRGYQYPQVYVPGADDKHHTEVAGHDGCRALDEAWSNYLMTAEFNKTANETRAFYTNLQRYALKGAFPDGPVSYRLASQVWSYLKHQYPRDKSLRIAMSDEELVETQSLAGKFEWALNSQVGIPTDSGDIKGIHGGTLAWAIIQALQDISDSWGKSNMMTLLFGDHRAMMAFASRSKLASEHSPNFETLPNSGASFVFELFSYVDSGTQGSNATKYPAEEDLFVRFFLRNETSNSGQNLDAYPLFGNSPSKMAIPFPEFIEELKGIQVKPSEWCTACDSFNVWCAAFTNNKGNARTGVSGPNDDDADDFDVARPDACPSKKQMHPLKAGVVGAAVVLAAGLVFGIVSWNLPKIMRPSLGGQRRGYNTPWERGIDTSFTNWLSERFNGWTHGRGDNAATANNDTAGTDTNTTGRNGWRFSPSFLSRRGRQRQQRPPDIEEGLELDDGFPRLDRVHAHDDPPSPSFPEAAFSREK